LQISLVSLPIDHPLMSCFELEAKCTPLLTLWRVSEDRLFPIDIHERHDFVLCKVGGTVFVIQTDLFSDETGGLGNDLDETVVDTRWRWIVALSMIL